MFVASFRGNIENASDYINNFFNFFIMAIFYNKVERGNPMNPSAAKKWYAVWNYSCLELRMETGSNGKTNVYAKTC